MATMLARMQALDIDTHLGHKPLRFEPDKVVSEGGEFSADMILFMPDLTVAADETCRMRVFHWLEQHFEARYLKAYR